MDFSDSMDDAWEKFINFGITEDSKFEEPMIREPIETNEIPECTPIFISTKTKIIYLNVNIDLNELFWKLPMIEYDSFEEGIIKKETRFNFVSKKEVLDFEENIKVLIENNTKNLNVVVLNQIDNPTGRVTFKDIRKVDIGICKNDLIKNKNKNKKKNAFYNSFVFIYRMFIDNKFKEFHIKLFNTGKIEIPGIQTESSVDLIMNKVIGLLMPYYNTDIYEKDRTTILINSNFSCNYYINREKLFNILKTKYGINGNYDPCSYPGILCKYKISNEDETDEKEKDKKDKDTKDKKDKKDKIIKKVSFMIFRTGSVLIVGKCNDEVVETIYEYLRKLFKDEYNEICELNTVILPKKIKKKVKKSMFLKN
jgi:TATA-box binding protein (TBP) (component of TFIID and TFIIIB)